MKTTPEYLDEIIYKLLQKAVAGDSVEAMHFTQAAQNTAATQRYLIDSEVAQESVSMMSAEY